MGPISCTETSVRNYQYTLRNIPENPRSQAQLISSMNLEFQYVYCQHFLLLSADWRLQSSRQVYPEDKSSKIHAHIDTCLPNYTASHARIE